jgi:hypothetical protein
VRERIAIGVGLAAVVGALAAFVTVPRERENGTNSQVTTSEISLRIAPGARRCQRGEFVPAHTRGVRVYLSSPRPVSGPVDVRISGGGAVRGGTVPRGPHSGPSKVSIGEAREDLAPATVCFVNRGTAPIGLAGDTTEYQQFHRVPRDPREDVRLDWLREERTSLAGFAGEAARRFALFKAGWVGPWTFYALGLALLGLGAAAVVTVRRAPRSPWACAAIGAGTAAVWAVLVPAFWVPDEPVHVGYAQYLAETGRPPSRLAAEPTPSPEVVRAYRGVGFRVVGRPSYRADVDRATDAALRGGLGRVDPKAAGYAVNNPPLYYALEAVPYRALHGASFWDRLLAMRLLSALLAGLTVALAFLFLRELFPRTPWAWAAGALAVAFQPVFGFVGGGVNNDNLVWACGAALLLALARALRRGLTPARGAAIAGALLVGMLSKPSSFGLIPGAVLGVALAVLTAAPDRRRRALQGAGVALAVVAVPAVLYLVVNQVVFDRPGTTAVSGFKLSTPEGSFGGQLAYLWQSFLPRLPFMTDQFTAYPYYLLWDSYLKGFIGRFGWFEYGYADWAYWLGLALLVGLVALAARAVAATGALRRRWPELVTYAALLGGMFLTVGFAGYRYRFDADQSFEQARYLFLLIPLWGAVVAAVVQGAGRWARTAATLLVLAAFAHTALSMLVTVERFYG